MQLVPTGVVSATVTLSFVVIFGSWDLLLCLVRAFFPFGYFELTVPLSLWCGVLLLSLGRVCRSKL